MILLSVNTISRESVFHDGGTILRTVFSFSRVTGLRDRKWQKNYVHLKFKVFAVSIFHGSIVENSFARKRRKTHSHEARR